MTKYTFLFCLLLAAKANGQNCPTGYEERNVKCDGKTVKKCIPVNLSCNKCWHVSYSDCQGNVETSIWGGSFDTYEECVRKAQDFQKNHSFLGNCPQAGNKYLITLLGAKVNLCTNSINYIAINDLKNKIIPFLKRYKAEVSNYRRYFSGKPYKPGAIVKDYESMLKQAEDNVKKLENHLNNITDQNLSEIETAFNDIQIEEIKLQQTHANYESYINNKSNESETATNALSRPNTRNASQSNPNSTEQLQNQLNTINHQFQTRRENNEQLFNSLQTGIKDISDILAQNAQRKTEARQRQYEADQQRRQQQLQAKLEEERKRQEEEERINTEMIRQFSIDSLMLSNNNLTLKTSAINSTIDSVYYIGYKRQYDEAQIIPLSLKVFIVYRYRDGTFPLFSNIVEKSKFENNINRYGITLLVGFFKSQSDVSNALKEIQSNAKNFGVSCVVDSNFKKINIVSTSKTIDSNFWNK
ncbi:hypothetical protein EJV47_17760 [Hymenobacter gummosus]|uniref:Uncharacterized protein n=1 Tax=Hymenobacter gummosus TaxID=1776032 RepID=A0A431TZ82_9BACT|nr:hypothetical protein [Hymenobacter gummosus]RTQ47767.1 hypothetical protein EJV47_17760 [Hymenobacter gummosus]